MSEHTPPLDADAAAALEVGATALLEDSLHGFFLADRQGRILQCNRACLDMLGIVEEQFIGKTIHDIDVVLSREEVDASIELAVAQGHLRGESRICGEGGEPIDIIFSATFMQNPGRGFFFCFFVDITERKRAEEALRESETRWRALAEGVNAALFIYQDGTLTYANEATSRITGYALQELIGMPVTRLMADRHLPLYEDRLAELKQAGTDAAHYRGPVVTRNGEERWVALSLAESLFAHRPAILGVAFDITEEVRMDGALRESRRDRETIAREMVRVEVEERRSLGALLHDGLAQDLAACRLQISSLRRTQDTPAESARLAGAIGLLDAAIRHSRDLIHDLSLPVLYEFGIDAALAELCTTMREQHGLPVKFESDGALKPCSRDLLDVGYRAVRELLVNADKHSGATEVTVQSRVESGQLALIVADNGKGFDPTLPLANLREGEGGFGLFFLPRRVERVGGTLDVGTRAGKGTRIRILLPCSATDEREGSPGKSKTPA